MIESGDFPCSLTVVGHRTRDPLKNQFLCRYVEEKLRLCWTQARIAGRLRRDFGKCYERNLCAETIYEWIYSDDAPAGERSALRNVQVAPFSGPPQFCMPPRGSRTSSIWGRPSLTGPGSTAVRGSSSGRSSELGGLSKRKRLDDSQGVDRRATADLPIQHASRPTWLLQV